MSVNITLEEIIKRKIKYFINDDDQEAISTNKGYIRGFEEILMDINMPEESFVEKYVDKIKEIQMIFDKVSNSQISLTNEDVDELSGYNNAVVEVLRLLNEKYLYE